LRLFRWDASFHLLDLRVRSCQDQRLRHAPFAPRSFLRSLAGEALPRPLELRRLLRCCKREAPSSFRVNPLKAAPTVLQHLREDLGWQLSPVPWVKDGFRVTNWKPQMGFNRPQLTGDIYFQEATSMLPAEVLRLVVENQRAAGCRQLKVLDMCAAPGSKSTQLGSWLMLGGGFVLFDISLGFMFQSSSTITVLSTNIIWDMFHTYSIAWGGCPYMEFHLTT